jgi:hypothetical protein
MKIASLEKMLNASFINLLGAISLFFLFGSQALAANHALIMTIGSYSNPNARLPGVEIDAKNAAIIAKTMGVPESNLQFLKDNDLTLSGFQKAFSDLYSRVKPGDGVFVYYSGHGTQNEAGNGLCEEGMVTHDMKTFTDSEIQKNLNELSKKTSRLIMMNDSCFSGGQAQSKNTRDLGVKDVVAKAFNPLQNTSGYSCGEAINNKLSRSVAPRAKTAGSNFLYIAASRDNEVAWESPRGGFATLGWRKCLTETTDSDKSGSLSGEEIRACAQRYILGANVNQHVALVGN